MSSTTATKSSTTSDDNANLNRDRNGQVVLTDTAVTLPNRIIKYFVDTLNPSQSGFYFYEKDGDGNLVRLGRVHADALSGDDTFEVDSSAAEDVTYAGAGGTDTYVIRSSLDNDIVINDPHGGADSNDDDIKNRIVFDGDVTVTSIHQVSRLEEIDFSRIELTLDTGAVITVNVSDAFEYVVGDSEALDFAEFITTYGDSGITPAPAQANRAPVFGNIPADLSIDENVDGATTPVSVGRIVATDADAGDTLTYSILNAVDQSAAVVEGFEVDGTGLITYIGTGLDAETITSVTLTVVASDGEDSVEASVVISVADLDDEAPTITSSATGDVLIENTTIPDTQVIYSATGTSDVTDISWSLGGTDAGLFDIDEVSGDVTFKEETIPDYEVKGSYNFTVIATLGALPAVAKDVTIAVSNVDDGDARFIVTSDNDLNVAVIGDVLTVSSNRADPDGAGTLTYQWQRDGVDIAAATEASYAVTWRDESYGLTATVSYTDGSGADETVTTSEVIVPVPLDRFVQFVFLHRQHYDYDTESGGYNFIAYRYERLVDDIDTSVREKFGHVEIGISRDVQGKEIFDSGEFVDGLELVGEHADLFELDGKILYLKAGAELDHVIGEKLDVRVQHVEDTSLGGDLNDAMFVDEAFERPRITGGVEGAPIIKGRAYGITLAEGTEIDTSVVLYDPEVSGELGKVDRFRWSFTNRYDIDLIGLDSETGELTFRTPTTPDYEVQPYYQVYMYNDTDRVSVRVTIRVIDLEEPEITELGSQSLLAEGVFSSDTDTGYSYTATYDTDGARPVLSVTGDNRFQFDANGNLQIKAGAEFDYETSDRAISLTITATDSGEESHTQTMVGTETVTIIFENEGPEITGIGSQNLLAEGVFSSDTNTGYSYTATSTSDGAIPVLSVSGDNRFQIDANGNLQIIAGSAFDFHTSDRSISLTITATDSSDGSGTQIETDTETVTITFEDDVPVITELGSQNLLAESVFSSDTNTGYSYTVAYSADSGALPVLSVSGDNRFQLDADGNLQIKAGSTFDYEKIQYGSYADRSISLTITATDSADGSTNRAGTQPVTITIENDPTEGILLRNDPTNDIVNDRPARYALATEGQPTRVLSGTDAHDVITGTSAAEVIVGGGGDDEISTGGGDDIVGGGYGRDVITLDAGAAETVIYRFESDAHLSGIWRASDGFDTINNFRVGEDKLVLVDINDDTPIRSFTEFHNDANAPIIFGIDYQDNWYITSLSFAFHESGTADGSAGGRQVGSWLTINFDPTAAFDSGVILDEAFNNTADVLVDRKYLNEIFGINDFGVGNFNVVAEDDLPSSYDYF